MMTHHRHPHRLTCIQDHMVNIMLNHKELPNDKMTHGCLMIDDMMKDDMMKDDMMKDDMMTDDSLYNVSLMSNLKNQEELKRINQLNNNQ